MGRRDEAPLVPPDTFRDPNKAMALSPKSMRRISAKSASIDTKNYQIGSVRQSHLPRDRMLIDSVNCTVTHSVPLVSCTGDGFAFASGRSSTKVSSGFDQMPVSSFPGR